MPQLLLELFSEEIPARMQGAAARDLARMAQERLKEADLVYETLRTFCGARRLVLVVDGLPAAQADRVEERKGPRVGAPDAAVEGFLRGAGVTREQLVERDGVYFATLSRTGRPTPVVVAEMVEAIVRGFPWPKSMTWASGRLRWVRPLKSILCVFDREVVPLEIDGLVAADLSEGHRFMGEGRAFRARDFDEYHEALSGHFVMLDAEARKARILDAARSLCAARGLELVEDEGLLDEVAGLAEWPTPILGDMDPDFLDLPPEVIRTSMRAHQKYFAVRAANGSLAPHFVVVANLEAADGGSLIAAGNARVLSARLNDARFFWDEDRKVGFEPWLGKLAGVTFHARLGTMAERAARIEALAATLAPVAGADAAAVRQAAHYAKADLVSGMVGEFPELQGLMGGYYAREAGLSAEVADAIRDHYRPVGPTDAPPDAPVSMAVALAEKLDTLTGFFAIGEKPTGSRDPFALRRAALGVIRIVLQSDLRLGVRKVVSDWYALVAPGLDLRPQADVAAEVTDFLADRLKVLLRDQGRRHDLVDAVFALGDDDLVRIVARVEALTAFLTQENGANLLAGYKRAVNILNAEAKKGPLPAGPARDLPGASPEEAELVRQAAASAKAVDAAIAEEDFVGAMSALSRLRAPVDAFFDKVLVNATDPEERANRLRLLSQVRDAMGHVADFSQVAG